MTAAGELAALIAPLVDAFGSPERADRLLRELGVLTTPGSPAGVPPALTDLVITGQQTLDALAELDDEERSLAEGGVALAASMIGLFDAVAALATVDASALDTPYDDPDLWSLMASSLPAYLFVRWLRDNHRTTLDGLALLSVVSQPAPGPPTMDVKRLIDVAGDLGGTLSAIPVGEFIAPLRRLFDAKGVTTAPQGLYAEDDYATFTESGITPDRIEMTFPVEVGGVGPAVTIEGAGEAVSLSVDGDGEVDLGGGWTLAAPGSSGAGLSLAAAPVTPWPILGGAGTTRIELAGINIGVSGTVPGDGSAPEGATELGVSLGTAGLRLVIAGGDSDSFIAKLLGAAEVAADMPFSLVWSPSTGFIVDGGVGLTIRITTSIAIGPITIVGLVIGLAVEADRISVAITSAVNAVIGPVAAVVDGIGLRLDLREAPGDGVALGPLVIGLAFQPPHGIGLAIDAGVASGGGYLYLDQAAGSYAGVLDIQVLAVGVNAIGIINTRVPGVDGWSMFFALFLGLPSIQLGFGFTLTGVGGLAGINRTIDTAALDAAVRGGALDSVLFPPDPIANAPIIIAQFQEIFPPANDQYVFGPVVRIGWGTPSLIEATVGIVITLPDPVIIVVLGTVSAALPTAEVGLVVLHLDVAGEIDFSTGTLAVNASLHDSYIACFALSGDMALRASFGSVPTFLMALGGFYPGFIPPGGFPELRRLNLAVSAAPVIDIHFSCYFAITSNTVQFGSEFGLSAQIEGFGIAGDTEFDALVFFHPFQVTTHLGFHIAITAAGLDLAGVWLDVYLVGPNPWHVVGDARFKVLGIETTVHVNEIIGGHRDEPAISSADLREEIIDALSNPDSWVAAVAGSPGVLLAAPPVEGETTVPAMPDGTVTVSQQVAPLDIALDKAGDRAVGAYRLFSLEPADASLAASSEVTDWFPPGFFFDIPPNEQVSSPSFEQLPAGARFGGGEPIAGPDRTASLAFEQILRDPELAEDRVEPGVFHLNTDLRAGIAATLSGGQSRPAAFAAATFGLAAAPGATFPIAADDAPVTVKSRSYAVTNAKTGEVRLRASSWSAAHQSDAAQSASATIVSSWEVAS